MESVFGLRLKFGVLVRSLVALSLLLTSLEAGQNSGRQPLPPLVPDRPGAFCGSLTVPSGIVQFETGISWDQFNEDGLNQDSIFLPLVVRVGLLEHLEFRLATNSLTHVREEERGSSASQTGFAGTSLGLKWQMTEQAESGPGPSTALIFALELPVGSDFLRSEEAQPTLNFISDFSLGGTWWLTTNLGVNLPLDSDTEQRFTQFFYAAAVGKAIGSRGGLFFDLAGVARETDLGGTLLVFEGGMTRLINNDVQVDFSVSRGLTDSNSDWTLGAGISFRFR